MQSHTEKLASCALLTSLALIFSYIEFLLPVSLGIPGIKLGFANIAVLICLVSLGPSYALFVNTSRILLAALLFGNFFSAAYAFSGGIISLIVMILLNRMKLFSTVGISMAGGVFHNLGQLAAAAVLMKTPSVIYYYPVLLIAGMVTGIVTGFIASLVIKKLPHVNHH